MMELKVVKYNTAEYKQTVELRNAVLLEPIGLPYIKGVFEKDIISFHCACFDQNEAIGCCVLTSLDEDTIQLRQMAVASEKQSQGIGAKVVALAEQVAIDNGFKKIILHARRAAESFYLQNGYEFVGEEFEEVNIPHMKMVKTLESQRMKNRTTEEQQVLDTVAQYIDITVTPFGSPQRGVLEIEKRDPMYGGDGVVYMLSVFEKDELVNNRIGVYMVLLNRGDQAGFHEHGSKKEQELYVLVSGQGEYIERKGLDNVTRTFDLKKGAVTAIKGEGNYHSIINSGDEPLIIFVVTTYEK